MFYKIKFLLLVAFSLFSATVAFSQSDDDNNPDDSLNITLLKDYNDKIKLIEKQRLNDSIEKEALEKQLSELKSSDATKKKELELQLQDIADKEQNRVALMKSKIDSLRANAISYPVIGFFEDTLFFIYNKSGSFTAHDRSVAISERIHKLKDNYTFDAKNLKLSETEHSTDIVYGETILVSVSEKDAIWNNTTRTELAKKYQNIISKAVIRYKHETSYTTLLKEIGLALLVVTLLFVLLYLVSRLFKWTEHKISHLEGRLIKGVMIKNYTLLDTSSQVRFFKTINKIIKWFVILLCIYIALPIIFGFFPWTQYFAQTLFGYVLNPLQKIGLGVWNYMPNFFTIAVIYLVFRYVLKLIEFIKKEIALDKLHIPGFYPDWANPTFQILRVVLYAFMLVLMFPYLPGNDSPIFQGMSVFLGFLFTFGSMGSLSNVVAGIVLTYMRLFKLGDRVKIGDVVGDVIEKSMLVTRVRTIKNEIVSIPNSTVMSSHTINYSNESEQGHGLILHTTVTIGYDVPWKDMHQALLNAADRTELLLKDPKPFVLQTSLDDFYVSYQINGYTKHPNKQASTYSELHKNIQDCCNEVGIEILSPHYRNQRDGNMTTIPANYLSKDYKAPSFNVKIDKDDK